MALAMVGLIAFLALVIDGGTAFAARRQMQNAADAAALAGTRELRDEATEQAIYNAVVQYAQANGVDEPADLAAWFINESEEHTGTYPLPGNGGVPSDALGVEVTTTTSFSSSFAGVIGREELGASASAAAIGWEEVPCAILAEYNIRLNAHKEAYGPVIHATHCIHSNDKMEIYRDSLVEGNAEAVNSIHTKDGGTIDGDARAAVIDNEGTITGTIDETPAAYIPLPILDFEPYRQIALSEGTYFATKEDFKAYLQAHNYNITGTFYVDDTEVRLEKSEDVTITGTLVIPGRLECKGPYTHYAVGSDPVIMVYEAKFEEDGGPIEIHGWIYGAPWAEKEILFRRTGHLTQIWGGIVAWKFHFDQQVILYEDETSEPTEQRIMLIR